MGRKRARNAKGQFVSARVGRVRAGSGVLVGDSSKPQTAAVVIHSVSEYGSDGASSDGTKADPNSKIGEGVASQVQGRSGVRKRGNTMQNKSESAGKMSVDLACGPSFGEMHAKNQRKPASKALEYHSGSCSKRGKQVSKKCVPAVETRADGAGLKDVLMEQRKHKDSMNPKFPRFFPDEFYDSSGSDTEDSQSSDSANSEEDEELLCALDEKFKSAGKKMSSTEVIQDALDWLYGEIAPMLLGPKKRGLCGRCKCFSRKKSPSH